MQDHDHDDEIITIELLPVLGSPHITGGLLERRTITATRREVMAAGVKSIQDRHALIRPPEMPRMATSGNGQDGGPGPLPERQTEGRRWRDNQVPKAEGNGMHVTNPTTKPAWPDPKTMNFTPDRRDPFSTLSPDDYDRRKKKSR